MISLLYLHRNEKPELVRLQMDYLYAFETKGNSKPELIFPDGIKPDTIFTTRKKTLIIGYRICP